eukprot:Blabericola_migrator_1__6945@NODE_3519_length_1711_cov_253_813260_g2185_i0_p1_GENE_NODE_3519_length_1711_cov_253_813260_g2185_i0NODE_3519_length_1711_cov_253_813260_g2185_i0_p1_ORF_typecomplete_len177_score20_02DUF3755/PF12579_8/0_027_NODE_3519_length_1711_cov_253_813260_g2185_i04721002
MRTHSLGKKFEPKSFSAVMVLENEIQECRTLLLRTRTNLLNILQTQHESGDWAHADPDTLVETSRSLVRLGHLVERASQEDLDPDENRGLVLCLEGVQEKYKFHTQVFKNIVDSLYKTRCKEFGLTSDPSHQATQWIFALSCETLSRGGLDLSKSAICSSSPLVLERTFIARPFTQ